MTVNDPVTYDQQYTDYQTDRSAMRRWVRGFYLRSAASLVDGPTIDFGCGLGALLRLLPSGSTGLEINQATVDYARGNGLDVRFYDAETDNWSLSPVAGDGSRYRSLVISHVLEHLPDPVQAFNRLLRAASGIGVSRALAIVPGRSGYASDNTHLTFVDLAMLRSAEIVEGTNFVAASHHYFPGNIRAIGDHFTHHELRVVYEAPRS